MKLVPFSILVLLALLYAGLTLAETGMYHSWEKAVAKQKELQQRTVFYQRLNAFTEQVLRRIAMDSQRDPALAELLKKRQIKVVVTPTVNPAPAAPAAPSTPAPAPESPDASGTNPPAPSHP